MLGRKTNIKVVNPNQTTLQFKLLRIITFAKKAVKKHRTFHLIFVRRSAKIAIKISVKLLMVRNRNLS